jgi:hypothetical protein
MQPAGIEDIWALGCFGEEYNQPWGVVLDFLGGEAPEPFEPFPQQRGPQNWEAYLSRFVQSTTRVSQGWRALLTGWYTGP